jgi:hypothetical protein
MDIDIKLGNCNESKIKKLAKSTFHLPNALFFIQPNDDKRTIHERIRTGNR